MSAEPPKPITQLAEPVDRTRKRGRSALDVIALFLMITCFVTVPLCPGVLFSARAFRSVSLDIRIAAVVYLCVVAATLAVSICGIVHGVRRHRQWAGSVLALLVVLAILTSFLLSLVGFGGSKS